MTVNEGEQVMDWDLSKKEVQLKLLIHELGHYRCAQVMGYDPKIFFDIDNKIFRTEFKRNDNESVREIENLAIISLGGHVAENICGFETCGFLQDQLSLFNEMRRLYNLTGNPFPYEKVFEMPYEVYQPYEQAAREILMKSGGKKTLETIANQLLEQYHNSKTDQTSPSN